LSESGFTGFYNFQSFLRGESEPSRIFHFDTPDIKAIRQKTGLSQTQFAYLIGVKAKTLQNWEQKSATYYGI